MRLRFFTLAGILFLMLTIGIGADAGWTEEMHREIELEDAKEVDVLIRFGAGTLKIEQGESDRLLDADFEYTPKDIKPEISYEVDEKGVGRLLLKLARDGEEGFEWRDYENEWTLRFTKKVPLSFEIDMGANNAKLDFTGLRLRGLDLDLGASETVLLFGEANKEVLRDLDINVGAAKFRARSLGNANFNEMSFSGGVGVYTLDFRGDLRRGADVDISLGLGHLTILVPRRVGCRVRSSESFLTLISADGFQKEGRVRVNEAYGQTDVELLIDIEAGLGNINIESVE